MFFGILSKMKKTYFSFSGQGVDVASRFKDNGLDTCNTGTQNTALACWDGLATTTKVIAGSGTSNHPNGATTTVYFRTGVGENAGVAPGVYTATTTITALAL